MADQRTNDQGEKICAHPACSCLMQEEEAYCSDACEASKDSDRCGCGHLACAAHAGRAV